MNIQLNPIRPEDIDFLRELYATTRYDIDRGSFSDEQKENLKRQQFEAQHTYYQQKFSQASFDLIALDKQPVGRIYLDTGENEIRLIDIALLPEFRGRGIGSKLLRDCQDKARRHGLPLRLRVEPDNPALRLYKKLGFRLIADEQTNLHLEWQSTTDSKKHLGAAK